MYGIFNVEGYMKSSKKVIAAMGEKYACHPANQVKKLRVPLADSAGTNLCRTFKKFRREMAKAQTRTQANNVMPILRAK